MMQFLLFGLCASIRLSSPKELKAASAATPEAEKHQAVLDYEVGEDEAAADPEQPVDQRDAAKTDKLEVDAKIERKYEEILDHLQTALNATEEDGSCVLPTEGCTDASASNFNANATVDDASCNVPGCTDLAASESCWYCCCR